MIGRCISWILLGFASIALAAPTHGQESGAPEPSSRYRVINVGPKDQLKIRKWPGATNEMVGSYAAGQKDIVVTGRRQALSPQEDSGGIWWEVIHSDDVRGWVNARYLEKDSEKEEVGFPLQCLGTEPFWDVSIGPHQSRFSEPQEIRELSASRWIMARGLRNQFAIRLHEQSKRPFGWLSITRAQPFCTDNMSDNEYPYWVTLIKDDRDVLGGCCYRSGASTTPVER